MRQEQVTVSAKIPKRLKEELESKGIRMSDAIRRGLERELKEAKFRALESDLKQIDLSKVTEEQLVRDIRETREER